MSLFGFLEQLIKILNRVMDWFTPTPVEKAKEQIGDVHDAANKVESSRGDFSDVDDLLK
jgi:hypothetical protein